VYSTDRVSLIDSALLFATFIQARSSNASVTYNQ